MADQLSLTDGDFLAYDAWPGTYPGPGVVFLHGLASDRSGTKAEALADHCRSKGYGFVRFDMYGHGRSSGRFEDGGPSRWRDDTVSVLDRLTAGPQILVGSSMGGWVMLLAALARPARVAALVGIAPAPDFTEDLMWAQFTPSQRKAIASPGFIDLPSEYEQPPMRIGRHLVEDGRANGLLAAPIALTCPVRLLHGQQDTSVPWQRSLTLAERLTSQDVRTILVKDGDHRLSRPQDLRLLCDTLDDLMATP